MGFPLVRFENYKALRDTDISDPTIEGTWRLGQMTSWSRWGQETGDLRPIAADSQEAFDQLTPLSTRVIFFAINLGGDSIDSEMADWRNFHSPSHRGDTTLKNSFKLALSRMPQGDSVPAFYITDVFKLVPTGNAQQLNRKIADDLTNGIDHVARCASLLRAELEMCQDAAGGQTPTLVAMGDAAYSWLTGRENDTRIAEAVDSALGAGESSRVIRMHHYTNGQGSNEERANAVQSVLDGILR